MRQRGRARQSPPQRLHCAQLQPPPGLVSRPTTARGKQLHKANERETTGRRSAVRRGRWAGMKCGSQKSSRHLREPLCHPQLAFPLTARGPHDPPNRCPRRPRELAERPYLTPHTCDGQADGRREPPPPAAAGGRAPPLGAAAGACGTGAAGVPELGMENLLAQLGHARRGRHGHGRATPMRAAAGRARSAPTAHARHGAAPCAELFHSLRRQPRVRRAVEYIEEYAAHEAAGYPEECRQRYHGLPFLQTINASWREPVCTTQVRSTAAGCLGVRCLGPGGMLGAPICGQAVWLGAKQLMQTRRHDPLQGGALNSSLRCWFQFDTYAEAYCTGANLALDLAKFAVRCRPTPALQIRTGARLSTHAVPRAAGGGRRTAARDGQPERGGLLPGASAAGAGGGAARGLPAERDGRRPGQVAGGVVRQGRPEVAVPQLQVDARR